MIRSIMECILCSIDSLTGLKWKITLEEILYVLTWISHRLCYSLLRSAGLFMKKRLYEDTTKGCWPKTCWQLNGCQVQYRERGMSIRIFWTKLYLEVYNFEVVAQRSHQENCAFLKNNGHFPAIWRMAEASILACGVCFKNFK